MREIKLAPGQDALSAIIGNSAEEKPKGRLCYRPGKGFTQNPLMRLPRNMKCPCHSGKKWKVCCLVETNPYIPADALENYKATYEEALTGVKAW